MRIFSFWISEHLLRILDDLVDSGHFISRSEAVRALVIAGLIEYLKKPSYIKEADIDGGATEPEG